MTADEGMVYELHFDRPIGDPENPRGWAQHYIGHTEDLDRRVAEHRGGHTAAIMRAVRQAGIGWHVVRTWPGTRDTERQIKLLRSGRRLCPECTEHPLTGAGAVARAAALRQHREAQAARRQRLKAQLETQRAEQARQREAAASDPCEDGRRMARQWLAQQDEAGRTADQIEAAHEYLTGPWAEMTHRTEAEVERYRGYTELVRAALAEFREYETETEQDAQEKENTTMRNPLIARREDREYERQTMARVEENMRDVEADQAEQERQEAEASEQAPVQWALPAELALERALTRNEAQASGPDEARQLYPQSTEFTAEGLPREASDDPGSWLARDGDGRVLEVDAEGHPGREASPDDDRPAAEAESDTEQEYTGEPGWTAADADGAYWKERQGEARLAEHDLQSARAGMDSFGFPVSSERAAAQRAEAEGVRREYETERREREAAGRDLEAEAGA
jgi:hypothetical protein